MKYFVELIFLFCLTSELNCIKINKCVHEKQIFTSPQNTQIIVGCETDTSLLECSLKKDSHPDQSCTYEYKLYGVKWRWELKSCTLQYVSSESKNYHHCQFILPSISVSGTKKHQ